MLHEVGLRKSSTIIETTGQELVQNGAIKADAVIQGAMDGVLFIDEAYALVAEDRGGGDQYGKEAFKKSM